MRLGFTTSNQSQREHNGVAPSHLTTLEEVKISPVFRKSDGDCVMEYCWCDTGRLHVQRSNNQFRCLYQYIKKLKARI